MRYLDRLVLQELMNHRDPEIQKKAAELLKLLDAGKTLEPIFADREVPLSTPRC